MPNFTPNGKIYIGNVPFDNSYRHTMTFASKEAQYAYFSSVCNQALDNTSYTYVRMNNSIRVPFNAERLYTYDYVMYQNSNYGSKWFYAFIVAVNYVNENMTELVLELDVMQTWYFDYTLEMGFVEREHVNDDSIGAHLNAEPPMELQYTYQGFKQHQVRPTYAVFLVTAFPKYNSYSVIDGISWGMPGMGDLEIVDGSEPVSGGKYQNQLSACAYLIYDLTDDDSVKTMYRDMQAYNTAGAGDAIIDAFTLSDTALLSNQKELKVFNPSNRYEKRWTLKNDINPNFNVLDSDPSLPSSLDGYYPKNNKMFTYPYCYLEAGDYSGRTEDYRFEYFEDGQPDFRWSELVISDAVGYLIPQGYKGMAVPQSGVGADVKPFTYDCSNKIPWMYSAYANWAAQNALANTLTVIGSMGSIGFSLVPGIGAATKVLGMGAKVSGAIESLDARYASEFMGAMRERAIGAVGEKSNKAGLAGGAAGLAGVASQYYKMERVPNSARGNTSGNAKLQNGYCGFYLGTVVLRNEFAHIVDDFFSMYGYQVDRVKVPNRTGRRNWNYVKMQNSCHRGTVPASDMDKINEIYNSGITFWHTSDIGNYSLDNSII